MDIDDGVRYRWLRKEFAAGRETYLAEGIPNGETLDKYIDEQIKKETEHGNEKKLRTRIR